MTCVCPGLISRLDQLGGQSSARWRPMDGALDARAHAIKPRVNQLQPTVFVDAIPELVAERKRRLSAA